MGSTAELVVAAKRPSSEGNPVTLKIVDLKLFSHGVFSNVYTGTLIEGDKKETVAIKKCWSVDGEVDLREIRILKKLNRFKQKNISTLLYFFDKTYGDKTCHSIVLKFMPMTLSAHIRAKKPIPIDLIETKIFTWQMFRGMNWMHINGIVHRDLKPQNILIDPATFCLQIADFGSSLIVGEYDSMSSYVVTRYYRAPELLLGSHKYGASIDVWSAGAVFAELLRGRTFLPGSTTENQLEKILECFGPPTAAQLQSMHVRKLKLLDKSAMVRAIEVYNDRGQNSLSMLMPTAPSEAVRLLEKIMNYTPGKRLCGPKLLSNSFFEEIFDPKLQHNGKPLNLLTKKDLNEAIAGDIPPGVELCTIESQTGGSGGTAENAQK